MDNTTGLRWVAANGPRLGMPHPSWGSSTLGTPIKTWTRDLAQQLGVECPDGCAEDVPFEMYLRLLGELEARAGGWPQLERLVRQHWGSWAAHVGPVAGTQFGSPWAALALLAGTVVPLAFPAVRVHILETEPDHLEVEAAMFAHGPTFLRLMGLVLVLLVEQAGYRPPTMEMRVESTYARYTWRLFPGFPARTQTVSGPDLEGQTRVEAACTNWGLSRRQSDVLRLMFLGRSNKEIAARLGIVEGTVELHVTQVLRKARVTSRFELLASLLAARSPGG